MTIVCFGEMLMRLSPPDGRLLAQATSFDLHFGGAEANVAVSLARLGGQSRLVSIAPANELGQMALAQLRGYGVDVSTVQTAPGRMGLYFMNPAASTRPADVIYDRAHSAFATAPYDAIDWKHALSGATWLHLSGVSPALGENVANATLRAAQAAHAAGVPVSFDGNYRGKLWSAWRKDGGAPILRELMAAATLAFANERDIGLILGKTFDSEIDAAAAAFVAFPRLQRIASTLRVRHDDLRVDLGAYMITRDAVNRAPGAPLGLVVDRIGAGDAFAAGLLHAMREGRADADALAFALAAARLKHGVHGDFNLVTAADVEALLSGEAADVRR